MATDEPPHLRVVSERTDAEIEHQFALGGIASHLIPLAANLMRIVRGAGKPWEVGLQCGAVVDAYCAYHEKVGHWPSTGEIGAMLRLRPGWDGTIPYDAINEARLTVVEGALQFAASTMLDQRLQIAAGDDQMDRGMRIMREERERNRAEWEARIRAERAPVRKPARRKPKKKPASDAKL